MVNFWTYGLNYWETVEDWWVYAEMCLTSIESSFHPCNIYRDCQLSCHPGEAKMCLRLFWGSQMPPPAKRVKATTYRCDSPEVAKLCLRLTAETDARSVGDSHPFCTMWSYILVTVTIFCTKFTMLHWTRLVLAKSTFHFPCFYFSSELHYGLSWLLSKVYWYTMLLFVILYHWTILA